MKQKLYRQFPYFLVLLFLVNYQESSSQTTITKKDYLEVIKTTREKIWQVYHQSLDKWQEADPDLREENPPRPDFHVGRLDALLYQELGDIQYAQAARQVLLESAYYDNYFAVFILNRIKDSGVLSSKDGNVIEEKILTTAENAVQYWPEWGTMNHCTDIINGLTAVMLHFPDHRDCPRWQQKRDVNLSCNWGYWHIEDSQNYIAPWMKPLIQTVELLGQEKEFYRQPTVKYYFDYLVQLMTPEGQTVKFGDGNPSGDYTWTMILAMLEKGAAVYRDGKMKWAAHQLFKTNIYGKGQAFFWYVKDLADAYLWADDSVAEEMPQDKSRLVLEDYVGKKVVFRSGWDPDATYLFLNYLEDAPFGIDGKEHIINTIPVETEKNHHGQADENAICLLMKNGATLLHDSGYRETGTTGPDGEFRADTYHNRLIVREGSADPHKRLLPFLLDGGQYREVQTKLMHFRTFKEIDVSRTRMTDIERGYQWDRVISYLKGKEWFVIFDFVKILQDKALTLANLFYTQDIVASDQSECKWVDTRYRTISSANQSGGFAAKPPELLLNPDNWLYKNPDNMRLLMYFPQAQSYRTGVEATRRCYQTEQAVYLAKTETMKAGDVYVFATLLIPHSRGIAANTIAVNLAKMEIYQVKNGYGLRIPDEDGFFQINAMMDLEAEYLPQNQRPRYNWESGRAQYGDLETDARYCYMHQKADSASYAFYSDSR